MIEYLLVFVAWTFLLYLTHRIAHVLPYVKDIHADHHRQVAQESTGWKWPALLLYIDTNKSTLDQWLTEVIPTLVFAWATGHWWIAIFYYVWAAAVQEIVEHNPRFSIYPWLTSGRWHLLHHRNPRVNYGVFVPVWDLLFGTYKRL